MSATHGAVVAWSRGDAAFVDRRYSRAHAWTFDGGATVPASSSPHVVRVPLSDPAAVDPEEAYVAALSSCHMLWFLDLASREGFAVDAYRDAAEGTMGTDVAGREWVASVVLRPEVRFTGSRVPVDADVERLHHAAHENCFLANSVKTVVTCEGSWSHV